MKTLAHFTTLVPIQAGREEALRKTLDDLGAGGQSPFEQLPGTHMARLYVLDHYGGVLRGPVGHHAFEPALLVLSAVVDGSVPAWLDELQARLEPTAEAVWSHCSGFPGMAGDALARWLFDHEVRPNFEVIAHDQATVGAVRRGLELRGLLGEFAARMQGSAPAVVRAAYRGWFGR
jgi:hypothetical protein